MYRFVLGLTKNNDAFSCSCLLYITHRIVNKILNFYNKIG